MILEIVKIYLQSQQKKSRKSKRRFERQMRRDTWLVDSSVGAAKDKNRRDAVTKKSYWKGGLTKKRLK